MAKKLRQLSWEKSRKRWRKMYKGRVLTFRYGKSKSDMDGYRRALEEFEKKRAEIDQEEETNKPHFADYTQAIFLREQMAQWCLLEGEGEQKTHDRLQKEIRQLRYDFGKARPKPLNRPDSLPTDPTANMPVIERMQWWERIEALEKHQEWTGTTDHAETVAGNVEEYFKEKWQDASTGQVSEGWVDVLEYRLRYFTDFAGSYQIKSLNERVLSGFRASLVKRVEAGQLKAETVKGILSNTKSFQDTVGERACFPFFL